MSIVLKLPKPDWRYDVYRVKRSLLAILRDRGYNLNDEMILLDNTVPDSKRYNEFLKIYPKLDSLQDLTTIYDDLKVYFCNPTTFKHIIKTEYAMGSMERSTRKKPKTSTGEYEKILFVCTEPVEIDIAISQDTKNKIAIMYYQQLYVDVRDHCYAPKCEILSSQEANDLTSSDAMKGLSIPLISEFDGLAFFYGLKKGDIVRIYKSSVYVGGKTVSITYRKVV